jgi:hypothetical protein
VPKVSLGMPVFNGERFIEDAIQSILSQSFEDFELVVSDNGSTDRTSSICLDAAKNDERVRYIRLRKNYGYVYNFNSVFRATSGPYFKWAASDDVCGREMIQSCVDILDGDPTLALAFPRASGIDEKGRPVQLRYDVPYSNSPKSTYSPDRTQRFHMLMRNLWGADAPFYGLIRSDILERTLLHGDYPGGDHVLLTELSLHGRFYEIGEPGLFFIRAHRGRGSSIPTLRERLAYADPTPEASGVLRPWRAFRGYPRRAFGYLAAIRRAPGTPVERMRCRLEVAAAVARWMRRPGRGGYIEGP